jgi:hypothetical protein
MVLRSEEALQFGHLQRGHSSRLRTPGYRLWPRTIPG